MVRRKKRRIWGWLPDKGEAAKLVAVLAVLGGWWDARTKPDPRTEAVASLASTGAEVDVRMTERLDSLAARMGRLEARLRRADRPGLGGAPDARSPAPAQRDSTRRGFFGWLSGIMGNR